MNGLETEERILEGSTSLSLDIAKHLSERLAFGKVVVLSRQPTALLSSTRKQWLRILRQLQRQRAGTTDAVKIADLTQKIASMQQAKFAAKSPLEDIGVDVTFATAAQLLEFAPACRIMYIATPTEKETLHKVTSFMPRNGLIVVYRVGRAGDSSPAK